MTTDTLNFYYREMRDLKKVIISPNIAVLIFWLHYELKKMLVFSHFKSLII